MKPKKINAKEEWPENGSRRPILTICPLPKSASSKPGSEITHVPKLTDDQLNRIVKAAVAHANQTALNYEEATRVHLNFLNRYF